MSLFFFLSWFIAAFMIGFLAFIVTPFMVGSLSVERRNRFAQYYFDLSMSSYRRVLCAINKHNDAKLFRSKWDGDNQAENIEVDDEQLYFEDPNNKMSRLHRFPFGFVHTARNKIIEPMDAEVGELRHETREDQREWLEFVTRSVDDAGEEVKRRVRGYNAHAKIPKKPSLVNMQFVKHVIAESHEPNDPEKAEENVKKSQLGYQTTSLKNMMIIIIACGAGAILAWLIHSNAAGAADSISLPIAILLEGWI